MTAATCTTCAHCQPQYTDPRMLRLGFSRCSKQPLPGRFVSAAAVRACFAPMTPSQASARKAALAQLLQQHKEKK